MYCPECGKEIADSARFCEHCGQSVQQGSGAPAPAAEPQRVEYVTPGSTAGSKPVEKKGKKRTGCIVAVVVVIALALACGMCSGSGDDSKGSSSSGSTTESAQQESGGSSSSATETKDESKPKELSAKEYKKACKSISYKKLTRTPQKYEGKKVKFTGKIIQVQEGGTFTKSIYRIDVTKGEYDLWDDTVYCTMEYDEDGDRFLEDDIVTFYGEFVGIETYTTVLGASVSIPSVDVKYMTLKKD